LRSYLGRLVIVLEAQVVNSTPESYDGPSHHEIIFSGSASESEDPLIIVQGPDENSRSRSEGHILVVWKVPVFLSRPVRLRPQNPSIIFSATANLKAAEQVDSDILEDDYLPSLVPSGLNLLESFGNDEALGGMKPRLSALRVSRVVPATRFVKDLTRPLKNISHRTIKVMPAFSARVRYARPNSTPSCPAIIASLDVDITPFASSPISIEDVTFTVNDGIVEDLNTSQGMILPMACLPRDDITFLYRLLPDEMDITKTNVKPVHIFIQARVKVSSDCEPIISLRWQTTIDFTLPVNPGFNQPIPPIQRDHRPSQLSVSSIEAVPTVASLAITRPDALPSMEAITRHQRTASIPDFGVTMTFTSACTTKIKPGRIFTWDIFVVNRSDRARKLALVVIPKRRRSERINTNRPPSTGYGRRDPGVADSVMDENILHAMQRNAAIEPVDIICLSTDIRIGPLAPSACHSVEMRFMPLREGVIGIEAVRVIDVATQEHVDIRDLPSIIVGPV
jgi:hypothetical protein